MNYAIIVAGGTGSRMGNKTPKQLLPIGDYPILFHTLQAFYKFDPTIDLVLVLHTDLMEYTREIKRWIPDLKMRIINGGESRFHSVKNGLDAIEDSEGIVFIHDAVRPFITSDLLERCKITAIQNGSAIPALAVKDSLRKGSTSNSVSINRADIFQVQTPQTFQLAKIKNAFRTEFGNSFTDDASVYEAAGDAITLCDGLEENIKITTPFDLELATFILSKKHKI